MPDQTPKYLDVIVSQEALGQFARFEITLEELLGTRDVTRVKVMVTKPYKVTPEDIGAAAKAMILRSTTGDEFWYDWYRGFSDDVPEVADALSMPEIPEDEEAELELLLPIDDTSCLLYCFERLDEIAEVMEQNRDACVKDVCPLGELIEMADLVRRNEGKPIAEMTFPDSIKREFIVAADAVLESKPFPVEYLSLFRRFTDELVARDDYTATVIKGYHLYGGSDAFACDWGGACALLERAFVKTKDPEIANALGYIYFSGASNNGAPQYPKAFQLYSFGANNGIVESTIKLAEMYAGGLGTFRSPSTAFFMYSGLFEELRKDFIGGDYEGKFAEVAYKMARALETGNGCERNPLLSYCLYLEAEAAVTYREAYHFLGDGQLSGLIRDGLEAMEKEMRVRREKSFITPVPTMLQLLCAEGPLQIELKKIAAKKSVPESVRIVAKRPKSSLSSEADPMLVLVPEIGYCTLQDALSLTAIGPYELITKKTGPFTVTDIELQEASGAIVFYEHGEEAAYLKASAFEFRLSKINTPKLISRI